MWWLLIPAAVVLLGFLPIGIRLLYDSGGLRLDALVGPVKVHILPGKKKDSEKKKKPQKKTEQKKPAQGKTKSSPKGGSITDFLPLVQLVLEFLGEFRRRLHVSCLELNLVLGGGDPCDLAVNYGKACAAMGNIWPRLEELLEIKKRDVKIQCDFVAPKTLVTARLDLTISIGRILAMGIHYGVRALKEFMNITNKRKGGVTL